MTMPIGFRLNNCFQRGIMEPEKSKKKIKAQNGETL